MRLLLVEDEIQLSNALATILKHNNYSVDCVYDGQAALDYLEAGIYDAVILDIMLPKYNGLEIVRHMRAAKNQTPVLFLTAKDSVSDRVAGLDAGAEDYLVKPFAFEELLARIRVMTRKSAGNHTNIFEIADLSMDVAAHTVTRGGQSIALSAKEFDILEYLLRNKGLVLSREKIENHIWNFDYAGGTNVIDVYIRYLRKKIDDPFTQKLIHTIRGKGYVLREEA